MAYIFRKPKSRFFWVGYLNGVKRVQQSLNVTSKKAAELLLAEYQLREAKYRHGSDNIIIRMEVQEVFDEFILHRAARESTKAWYENHKRTFLEYCKKTRLVKIQDVGMSSVESFYTELKQIKPGAARGALRALKAVFSYAVKKGYLHENIAKAVKQDKPTRKLFRNLTFEEIDNLLSASKKHGPAFYPFFATAYYAGLREGELIYLQPSDIDYNERYVYVRSKPENLIKDHQERKIPLNTKLADILRSLTAAGKWLFGTKDDKPRKNNLNRELKRVGKTAKINTTGLCVQALRETFGSHLRRRRVDIALISQYMGHSSIDVTLRHYANIPIEQTHKEIDML